MKGRTKRNTGGANEAAEDLKTKNQRYTYQSKVNDEAEERKDGGRAKKKKMVGTVMGELAKMHAGRKPRKSGGTCESSPFTSARKGTPPPGRKLDMEME